MDKTTSWSLDIYAKNARFVSDLGEPLIALLQPTGGESILDLGCGDGALTTKIAASGCAVIGIDASFEQVRATRDRGLAAAVMDAHHLGVSETFDAVFTNAALHWMKEPQRVVAEVWKCLKPGGRFVGEFGGNGNVEKIRSALHRSLRKREIDPASVDPWYYPSVLEYSELLQNAGFYVNYIALIPRPTKLLGDILDWLAVFAQPFTNAVPSPERAKFLQEVRSELSVNLRDAEENWIADYVRLRFAAIK